MPSLLCLYFSGKASDLLLTSAIQFIEEAGCHICHFVFFLAWSLSGILCTPAHNYFVAFEKSFLEGDP